MIASPSDPYWNHVRKYKLSVQQGGLQLLHDLVNSKAGRLLARQELLERLQEFADMFQGRNEQPSIDCASQTL